MNLIIESQYFPPVIYYKISYNLTNMLFEQCETYQKMSFRNRCQIAGSEGIIDLSIPLAGGRDQKRLTREVRVAEGWRWQAQHWKTIVSCYNRSPWFEYYRDGLEALFQRRVDFLIDWNLLCFEWSLRALGMSKTVALTERYQERYSPEEGIDWRGKIVPKHRGEWPAMAYRQVFEERTGFIPNLSVLDLLFCEGKEAVKYIR
jgi:hypothetical protein